MNTSYAFKKQSTCDSLTYSLANTLGDSESIVLHCIIFDLESGKNCWNIGLYQPGFRWGLENLAELNSFQIFPESFQSLSRQPTPPQHEIVVPSVIRVIMQCHDLCGPHH